MSNINKQKDLHAKLRANRTRSHVRGTAEMPRITVKRSSKHINVQLIDDTSGKTLAHASDKEIEKKGKPVEVAHEVGKVLAEKAKLKGITRAVFDKGPYRYHGRVAAVADGSREAGLKF